MGEEYDETAAVPLLHRPRGSGDRRRGRRGAQAGVRAFSSFGGEGVPDPQAEETFSARSSTRGRPIRSTASCSRSAASSRELCRRGRRGRQLLLRRGARDAGRRPRGEDRGAASAARVAPPRATYRLQLRRRRWTSPDARGSSRTSRARHQPPVSLARAAGAARLDPRLRRRRSDVASRTSSAATTSCGALCRGRARASCSTSSRTTWPRATRRIRSGATRELRAPVLRSRPRDRRGTAGSSTSTSSPACGSRIRRCSRPRTA